MTAVGLFLFFMFFLYSYLVFGLVDTFLENSLLKKVLRIPLSFTNAALSFTFVISSSISAPIAYVALLVVLFMEFYFFYRDAALRIYFCAAACVLHVMSIRSIVTAIFSFVTGYSVYEVVSVPFLFVLSLGITFALLNIATIIVLMSIPASEIKIINQHGVHLWFMCIWISIFTIYLLINSSVYEQPQNHPDLTRNQFVAPFAILIGLYVVLFFAIQTGKLLGYKAESLKLYQKIQNEKQYRESMTRDALIAHEFNLTKDILTEPFVDYKDGKEYTVYGFRELLDFVREYLVFPEDIPEFTKQSSPDYLLYEFSMGRSETVVEYRRLLADHSWHWVRTVVNLVREPASGDIRGFSCVKDIDIEKKHQIELQFKAERDSLTGLYNKEMTGKLIADFLLSEGDGGALFIVDIDNFKSINDHLGHTYGDAVLGEIADKLRHTFRTCDIIGRIGGDEFIAFMKNVTDRHVVTAKAQDICRLFHSGSLYESAKKYTVSGSVGISLFPTHGTRFEQLYKNADIALYVAKNKGKDTFRFYEGNEFAGYEGFRTKIDDGGIDIQKNFRNNRIEYIFKILYDCESPIAAIYSVLELIAGHFGFDRGYIFEINKDKKTTSNTFEWCVSGIKSQKNELQNVPLESVSTAIASFYETGTFMINDIMNMEPDERAYLEPQGIKSMFQFGLFAGMELLGFIGFDNCSKLNPLSGSKIDELKTICNILSTFFVKQRITEKSAQSLAMLSAVMNNVDNFMYVIDKDTYEIQYVNEKIMHLIGTNAVGELCYKLFRKNSEPCVDCPLKTLPIESHAKVVAEIHNAMYDLWTETTASHIDWIDGRKTCLINCVDITKFKKT